MELSFVGVVIKAYQVIIKYYKSFIRRQLLTLFLERSGITFPGEGGSICPTYTQGSFSALEPPKGQKSCFHISLDHFQLIWAFLGIFFNKSQENAKIENLTKKLLKNEWNFKILQFLTYINILYIKGKHFSCRIQFHKEKVWFYAKKNF